MPYTNNKNINVRSWMPINPIRESLFNKGQNQIYTEYEKMKEKMRMNPELYKTTPSTPPPKAKTFSSGFDVGLQRFVNNMKYLGATIQKASKGEEYFPEIISKLQSIYNNKLANQSIQELEKRMDQLDEESYEVPFPAMNPTHAISLRQPRSMKRSVEYDMLNKIVKMKRQGYDSNYIERWLSNAYTWGGEGTKRQQQILNEAAKIPETEGWGTIGDFTLGSLDFIIPLVGGTINPALGLGLAGAIFGKNAAESIAESNKEISSYERYLNHKIPDINRNTYVSGMLVTDMLLGSIMQTRYFKNINLPYQKFIRKSLSKKIFNAPNTINEFNTLLRKTITQSSPQFVKKTGRLALEQAGASAATGFSHNMMQMLYKNPEDYPELSKILNDVTTDALYGAGTGLVVGGVSSGLGMLRNPRNRQNSFTLYDPKVPTNPLIDTEGLSLKGYMDREEKIKRIIKENFKPTPYSIDALPEKNRLPLSEQYKLTLPDNPMFDIGNMSLKEYNELVPQLRSALKDYYMYKPKQSDNLSEQYKLDLPDDTLFDLEGLTLKEWLEREEKIKSILGDKYVPTPPKNGVLPYDPKVPTNPLIDTEGLSLKGYMDREEKIKRIIKENFKPTPYSIDALPEKNRLPLSEQYKLTLPDNPMFDIGNMSLKEYNELVPQLRSALKDYYMYKPQQSDNLPEQYKLDLPDDALFDLEGLTLKEWLEREEKIKSILGDKYKPRDLDLSEHSISSQQISSENNIWQDVQSNNEYSNSLKRSLVKDAGEKLNIKTRMFANIEELPSEYKKYLDDHSYSKGFYNPETGEVVVIGNNITSQNDLQNHLIQKGYESKGLESILGSELDNLLEEVYNNMSNKENRKYSHRGDSSKTVALNYISDLVKHPEINPNEWTRLSSYVRDLFKSKYSVDISDDTISNLLWRTANQITGDDSIEDMIRKSR